MKPHIHFDANEGRTVEMSCLDCGATGTTLHIVEPARMYVAALVCDECAAQVVTFDQLTLEVAA